MTNRFPKWIRDADGRNREEYSYETAARIVREEWQERIDAQHAEALVMDDDFLNKRSLNSRIWGTDHHPHYLVNFRPAALEPTAEYHRNDFHWRGGLFFARLTCDCVMIYSELRRRSSYDGALEFSREVIAVIPPNDWASIIASSSKGGETTERFFAALDFHSPEPKDGIPDRDSPEMLRRLTKIVAEA